MAEQISILHMEVISSLSRGNGYKTEKASEAGESIRSPASFSTLTPATVNMPVRRQEAYTQNNY
jgi:hypothetical protein